MDKDDHDGDESLYEDGGDNDSNDSAIESADVSSGSDVFDELEVGLFGPDDICFYGEVGLWKESGVGSQMVNAREVRGRGGSPEVITNNDEMVRFHAEETYVDDAGTIEVPEEYDRPPEYQTEEELFGKILPFPTDRRPVTYRRKLKEEEEAEAAAAWFATRKITLGEKLQEKEKKKAILLLYTWKDAFANALKDMPVTDLVEHQIPVSPGSQPRRARDKIYTKEEKDWLELNIPKLERAGIIGRSDSPWSHRTKFVRKKDGGLRMVHVFCPINAVTMVSSYPMRRMEPVINNLMQARFSIYFQADAANGFWAVKMNPTHAYRTAFSTHDGQWQYLRMGQGLAGAPLTYARLKDLFSGAIPAPDPEPCLNRCSAGAFECFVDDDFGAHTNFNSLFNFLHDHYFPRLLWARITLKDSKSGFFLDNINPLGYESDGSGLRPSVDKVRAIREYPRPTNLAEMEVFLYMTIFLRQWITGRAEHARLLKKAIQFKVEVDGSSPAPANFGKRDKPRKIECGLKWGSEQETSFRAIKQAIIENVVYGGDETIQYHLMTDASQHAIGGVLFQLPTAPAGTNISTATRKDMKVIMFISKRLLPAETRYSTTEREALAILRGLEEVRWLILGSPFPTKVYTDHQALVILLRKDDAHGRIVRWQIRLAEYDIEYIHIPGKENVLADGLSRMRGREESRLAEVRKASSEVAAVEEEKAKDVWREWLEDEWYGEITYYKLFGDLQAFRDEEGRPLTARKRRLIQMRSRSYRLIEVTTMITQVTEPEGIAAKLPNRLVYVERNGKEAFCVRRKQVPAILHYLHDCHGHFAAGILSRTLIGRYSWPTRGKDVHVHCATCPSCQLIGPLKPSVSQMAIVHLQPLDMMGFDFVGRFPDTPRGNKYIVIGVDYFTRFLFAEAVPDSQGKSAVALLMRVVKMFGWPRSVYTDNGAHFVQGEFAKTLQNFHVVHHPAPKSHPQSVGLAERYVRLLGDGLKVTILASKAAPTDWDLYIASVVHSINTRILSVHGFSPAELLLGYNPNRIGWDSSPATERAIPILMSAAAENLALWDGDQELAHRQLERLSRIDELRAEAADKIVQQAEFKMKHQQKPRFSPPESGDLVLLRRFLLDQRRGSKLEARWEGPYLLGDLAHHGKSGRLYDLNTKELVWVKKGALKDRVHLNDLKRYLARPVTTVEEANLVDLLEYGKGDRVRGEHIEEVYDLSDGSTRAYDGASVEKHVRWWDEAQGVG